MHFNLLKLRPLLLPMLMFVMLIHSHSRALSQPSLSDNTRAAYDLPPEWAHQTSTDNPHFIIVMLGANPRINDIPLLPGDFIGAFYTDEFGEKKCGGADYWLGDENIIFPAFRNDSDTPEKDGFTPGETIHFKFFSWTTQKEYDVDLILFDPTFPTTNKWYPLGLSSVINIAAFTNFDIYATATPNPICIGDQVTLSAEVFVGTTGNYSYVWSSDPPGLNSTLQTVIHTPEVSTRYFLVSFDGTFTSEHQVMVVVNTAPGMTAGPDLTICANQTALVTCFPFNNNGIMWSSSGDGVFNNPALQNPVYTPGASDKANGSVILTATALPLIPCTQQASDALQVTILPLPALNMPATLNVCKSQQVWVSANAQNYSTLQWTTSGDGTIANPTSLTTQYIPGSFDLALGYFTLTCCLNAVSGCTGTVCKSTIVTLIVAPTVTSPATRKRCENITLQMNSVAANYSSILWSTAGDGVFNNPNMLNPIYYPGPEDFLTGGTVVTVRAFGNGACLTYPAISNTTIIIDPLPKLNPGDVNVFCKGYPLQLNATAQYYGAVSWSTSGNGTFSNAAVLNPIYYPGSIDLANNGVNLTLTASALPSCTGSVSAVLEVHLVNGTQAQIVTPAGQQLCAATPFGLEATASDFTSLSWTTSGDGIFDDPATLNPNYYPGPVTDLSGNPVHLTLTAFAPENCGANAVKTIQVTFFPQASVDAGIDATITEPADFSPEASANNYSNLFWETSGDGQFSNPGTLVTNYTPGIQDLQNGSVVLSLTAYNIAPCTGFISDQVSLTIKRRHTLQLVAGWQGISSFVFPDNISFEQLMAPIAGQLQFAQTMTQVYWPEYGINTIGDFSNADGYKIKLNAPVTLDIIGVESQPKTLEIPAGWSILPVLSGCEVAAEIISGQLGTNLIIISEIGGINIIWPEMGIFGISHFIPGKAYMIKISQPAVVTFPDCANP